MNVWETLWDLGWKAPYKIQLKIIGIITSWANPYRIIRIFLWQILNLGRSTWVQMAKLIWDFRGHCYASSMQGLCTGLQNLRVIALDQSWQTSFICRWSQWGPERWCDWLKVAQRVWEWHNSGDPVSGHPNLGAPITTLNQEYPLSNLCILVTFYYTVEHRNKSQIELNSNPSSDPYVSWRGSLISLCVKWV